MSTGSDTGIQQFFATALALHQQGNLQEAARLYQQVLASQPEHADALHLLGVIAHQAGNNERAITLIQHALQLQGRNPGYHYNLASVYQAQAQLDAAIRHYKLSLKYQPANADAWSNLAVAYQDMEQLQEARQANQQALKYNKQHFGALQNMGTLLYQQGHFDDARKYLDRLLQQHPMLAEVQSKKADAQLLQGAYAQGWSNSRWRYLSRDFTQRNPPRFIPFPLWSGQKLHDKTLLISGDQGVGDVMMFASCLPDVLELVNKVMLECDARLVNLFRRSFPQIQVLATNKGRYFYWYEALGPLAYRCNMAELGMFFRGTAEAFPEHEGYLQVDANKLSHWQAQLRALGEGLKVGISWRGGANERAKNSRSIALANWKVLADIPGVQLVNLQYGNHGQEIAQFNAGAKNPLHNFTELDPIADIDGFAALVKALDLVISIDNTTVHVAGALNIPVWILLPRAQDWRWLLKRNDSPWYPSARLFRADALGAAAMIRILKAAAKTLASELQVAKLPQAVSVGHTSESKSGDPDTPLQLVYSMPDTYALLLNDTSVWYHWGCSCTSLAIHERLRQKYAAVMSVPISDTRELTPFPVNMEQFDDDELYAAFVAANAALVTSISKAIVVVINGEGTLHGLSQAALVLLYLAYIAKVRLNKRVCIINHSCYPDGSKRDPAAPAYALYRKVYEQVDFITVREEVSAQEFSKMNIKAVQAFDSLPLFIESRYQRNPRSDQKPYIVMAGSVAWGAAIIAEIDKFIVQMEAAGIQVKLIVGAAAYMAADDVAFVQALAPRLRGSCELVLTGSEAQWLHLIEHASALVSGRFHHTIAAAFLATPFVVMASNTPKIQGLLQMLEIDAFLDDKEPELAQRLHAAVMQLLQQPERNLLAAERREVLLELARQNYAGI